MLIAVYFMEINLAMALIFCVPLRAEKSVKSA